MASKYPMSPEQTEEAAPNSDQEHSSDSTQSFDLVPECQISFQGGKDLKELYDKCRKNPNHEDFVPIAEFLNPEKGWCDPEKIGRMRELADRTVKITAFCVSKDRPDHFTGTKFPYPYSSLRGKTAVRVGTGCIWNVKLVELEQPSSCPCKECLNASQPRSSYYKVYIETACHVIYDSEEAVGCKVELFYDSDEDKKGVIKLRGERGSTSSSYDDKCGFFCYTHDESLVDRLGSEAIIGIRHLYSPGQTGWIISHPHGRSKHVSKGKIHPGGRTWRGPLRAVVPVHKYRLPTRGINRSRRNFSSMSGRLNMDSFARSFSTLFGDGSSSFLFGDGSSSFFFGDGICAPGTREREGLGYDYYSLPVKTKWIFPEGSSQFDQFHQQVLDIEMVIGTTYNEAYYVPAPRGTKVQLPGNDLFDLRPIPGGAEIYCQRLLDHLYYDISTCPGSSGAPIVWMAEDGQMGVSTKFFHSSAEKHANRSTTRGI